MAVTRQQFLASFPEFGEARAPFVEAKLAEAARSVYAPVWGTKADDGVKYLAAHLLAPYMKWYVAGQGGETPYLIHYRDMRRGVGSAYRIVLPGDVVGA